MRLRKRLLFLGAILLLLGVLTALLAPYAVARGLRVWLGWAARQEGVAINMAGIDAPFLHAITIDQVRLAPGPDDARAIDLQASRVILDLNFRGWLFSRRARLLHSVRVEHLRGRIQRTKASRARLDWRSLHRLLPDVFGFQDADLDVTTDETAFAFHGVNLNGSDVESGSFTAHDIHVTSPILRQNFTELRGATAWDGERLTIAGLPLVRGLDLETLTIDLSRLTKRQLGLDFQLDAFGGTLRVSVQGSGGEKKFGLDLAGSAANISLAQISAAAGLLEPLTGSVHAAQFTFRGSPGEFLDATASIWIELSDFAWRERRGDHLVFGATYYDRRLQVEQLYVQQQPNELTVNGEFLWPKPPARWNALQFRGVVNAAIPDANAFAQLFGAQAGDFSGALSARGEIDSLDPSAHGRLGFRGDGLRFRGVSLDSLGGIFQLQGSEATLANLEIRHGDDFLRGHGTADLTGAHRYSARLTGAIGNLLEYAPVLPAAWRASKIGGGVTFDWTGDGTAAAHSGTMQIFAHSLQLPFAALRAPIDVTLEGTYSPQDVFFRTFKLADDRISLGGFLMLGPDFVELQALQMTLDGMPRVSGTLFLPLSFERWRKSFSLLDALEERQKFDVDLMVDNFDLAELPRALGEAGATSGLLSGKLAAYGPLSALQLTTNWRLQNLGPSAKPNTIDFDSHIEGGRADANLRAQFGVSAPLRVSTSLPLRLEKKSFEDGSIVDQTKPFWLTLDCPALFPSMMPEKLRPFGVKSGLVSGQIVYSGTVSTPIIDGSAEFLDLKINPPPPLPALTNLTAALRFGNREAVIDRLAVDLDGISTEGRGSLTTTPSSFALTLQTAPGSLALAGIPARGSEISDVRLFGDAPGQQPVKLQEVIVRGKTGANNFSLTIRSDAGQTTLFVDPRAASTAGPLLLHPIEPSLNDKGNLWP